MRIAIDARLNAYRQGGIPQYTRQLVTALADVAAEDQIVSLQHRDQLRPLAIAPNVLRRTALTPPHHRFEQWTLPLEVLLARPDVLHCPDFIAPTRRFCPAVVTIHDLAFMHYPEILDTSARAYYSQVTSNAPRADAIIAVSESTRQDIAQFLDIPIEQIDVIYEAAAPLYTKLELREGEARVLNSTPVAAGTFMLFVSTLEPRKNLPTLLQALRICIDRRPEAGYRLVIVGRRGWRDDAIFQTARDLKLADHVLFTGNVGQYDLRWLYNACRLYINPSLYEGFGLPLLEAMACGAACLAAATSSLPEIGGDAAIYVPPLEAEQWADAMMALWDDEDRRAELGRVGMARAQQFSWNRTARETLKVYRRAAERVVPRAEPHPAPRPTQPPEPHPAATLAALGPDAPRPCLRCGTALLPGELQLGMRMRSADSAPAGMAVVPRLWSCPRCGYVELVDETHLAGHHEHAVAGLGVFTQAPPEDLPTASVEANGLEPLAAPAEAATADGLAALDDEPVVSAAPDDRESAEAADEPSVLEDEAVASAALSETTTLDEPAVLEDEAVASDALSETTTLDEPSVLEDQPAASAEPNGLESFDAPVEAENKPSILEDETASNAASSETTTLDEPSVLEDQPAARVALDEPERDEAPADHAPVNEPGALQDPLEEAPADHAPVNAPVALENPLADQLALLEARAVAGAPAASAEESAAAPADAQAELSDTAASNTHTPTSGHAPTPANGTLLKSKSGHRSRRQAPAADASAKQPAKRRSSGSKRKQTT